MNFFLIPEKYLASLRLEQRSCGGKSQLMQVFFAMNLACSGELQKKTPVVKLF
jgi:hypothetical protein